MVFYTFSKMASWDSMAESYLLRTPYSEKRFAMETGLFGRSRYNGALTFGSNTVGLYVEVLFIFRWWHPSLFIPWSDIVEVTVPQENKKRNFCSFP